MLEELLAVLASTSIEADRKTYASAIIEENCLGKRTLATRRLSNQRLGELYALDPNIPLFRILRRLWSIDESGRPLLAMLAAIARDPLLRATALAVITLTEREELDRARITSALRKSVGDGRLSGDTLAKVVRNVSSSWTQSGHLAGRTFKSRQYVVPTAPTVAFGLYLGHTAGFRGSDLLACQWLNVLDCGPTDARNLALDAKRLGLIDLRISGDIFELEVRRLDPWSERA